MSPFSGMDLHGLAAAVIAALVVALIGGILLGAGVIIVLGAHAAFPGH